MKRLTTLFSRFLLSALVLFAQEAAPEAAAAAEDTLNLLGLIQQGGWAMYPLGTCSLIMFFLIFYSWKETTPNKFFTAAQLSTTSDALKSGNMEQGHLHLQDASNLLARALSPALKKIRKGREKTGKPLHRKLGSRRKQRFPMGHVSERGRLGGTDDRPARHRQRHDQRVPNNWPRRHGPARTLGGRYRRSPDHHGDWTRDRHSRNDRLFHPT